MIRILWFAKLKEIVGAEESLLEAASLHVSELKLKLQEEYKGLPSLDGAMVAVNEQYANDHTQLHDGDTVAFIPPVSGG